MLLDPKPVQITAANGQTKTFIVSRMPYGSGGREVLTQFVPTAAPKVGDYDANHRLFLKMMCFVAVVMADGSELRLTTQELVDSHIPDFRAGLELERQMLEHNLGFSVAGGISTFFDGLRERLPALITQILTEYRAQLSAQEKRP